jgi:hypothetical protein
MRRLGYISRTLVVSAFLAAVSASSVGAQTGVARSFEQLQVLVGPGDSVSLLDASGEEFSGRIINLTPTELVVAVDGQPRTLQQSAVTRIRQRRGDSLRNGMWIGFGIGTGLAVAAVAAIAFDEYEDVGGAGWAAAAVGLYGAMGVGVGATIDALVCGVARSFTRIPLPPPLRSRWCHSSDVLRQEPRWRFGSRGPR